MKIAFYKAKHGNNWDKIIAWWTRPSFWRFWESGKFSHVEILFDNGMSFAASPRDGGCRWAQIDYKPDRWVFVDLGKMFHEERIKAECNREVGKPYDWLCILSFVIPLNIQDPKSWVCSEIIAKFVFNLRKPSKYSPNKLYTKISPYYKIIEN